MSDSFDSHVFYTLSGTVNKNGAVVEAVVKIAKMSGAVVVILGRKENPNYYAS